MSSGIDLTAIMNNLLTKEIEKEMKLADEEQKYASNEVVARVEQHGENNRKFCMRTAVQIMGDNNSSEAMNYNWADIITLAEKIRAYVEGGICIDSATAWRGVPKEVDSEATLGDN